jgi:hypothetical protein
MPTSKRPPLMALVNKTTGPDILISREILLDDEKTGASMNRLMQLGESLKTHGSCGAHCAALDFVSTRPQDSGYLNTSKLSVYTCLSSLKSGLPYVRTTTSTR